MELCVHVSLGLIGIRYDLVGLHSWDVSPVPPGYDEIEVQVGLMYGPLKNVRLIR